MYIYIYTYSAIVFFVLFWTAIVIHLEFTRLVQLKGEKKISITSKIKYGFANTWWQEGFSYLVEMY